jgi:3-phosphoshikimate 1-carboxyvinyltransferase
MLAAMGVPVDFDPMRTGAGEVRFDPRIWDGHLEGLDFTVPGDASSAAFLLGAALISRRCIRVEKVGANPGRTAFLEVLEEMGATITREAHPANGGEPVETWVLTPPDQLEHFEIGGDQIPALIDEIPLLAVLASRTSGRSVIRDATELRVKETDRIRALATNLSALGVVISEQEDGLSIEGSSKPLTGRILSYGDHRIAMAFGVLGLDKEVNIAIDDPDWSSVSFPGFSDAIGVFEEGS